MSSERQPAKRDYGDDDESTNPGSNLFVTGIHPRLSEEEVTRLFEKYGQVEKCNIMRDPHTRDSRGFGFVKMVTADEADAAKEGLQGDIYEGRTLSIEKARRARPRTPTPGKYFGPPKRGSSFSPRIHKHLADDRTEDGRGPPPGRDFGRGDRYNVCSSLLHPFAAVLTLFRTVAMAVAMTTAVEVAVDTVTATMTVETGETGETAVAMADVVTTTAARLALTDTLLVAMTDTAASVVVVEADTLVATSVRHADLQPTVLATTPLLLAMLLASLRQPVATTVNHAVTTKTFKAKVD